MMPRGGSRLAIGGGWTLWPHVLLRAAGFPFAMLDAALRDPSPKAIRRVAANPTFREAVTWQNRSALLHGVDRLLSAESAQETTQRRKARRLVARYLQRYAAKNDTIGFFGHSAGRASSQTAESLGQGHH